MKNKFFVKISIILFIIFFSVFHLSCSNEEAADRNKGKVELLSFGPVGSRHGDTLKVIGSNLNSVKSIELVNASIEKNEFISQSAELIEFIVPAEAKAGKLKLVTLDNEEIISKTNLNFNVPVKIVSITEEARPRENIVIKGENLTWIDSIQFGTRKRVIREFEIQNKEELVFEVPFDAKSGSLIIYTGGTEPLAVETEQVVKVTLPSVTLISSSSVKHGDVISLTGSNLDLVGKIIFKGVGDAAITKFESRTKDQILVKVPNNAVDGGLTLVTAYSLVEIPLDQEIKIVLPKITSLNPNPIDDAALLTLTGSNLDLVKAITFTPNITTAAFISQSASKIVLQVPTGAVRGSIGLTTIKDFIINTNIILDFTSSAAAPNLSYYLYKDSQTAGWDNWSYGGATDLQNTTSVFEGSHAIKKDFEDWGVVRLHTDNPIDVSKYSELVFYVFGTESYTGQDLYVIVNEAWGDGFTFKAVKGEWTQIIIPIANINGGNARSTWNDFMLRSGMTGTMYFDHIGLR